MDREKVITEIEDALSGNLARAGHIYRMSLNGLKDKALKDSLALLKEQEAVVHPEPSCEMTYITDCCCDLCGVQLIREDNFCRCCGKRIEWGGR